ncbi:L-rhamnose mutarotase [Arcicella rigui]|uniref:L-rhamnose mutarotase n=1 Tax=Arcicella rigui TaxID=797020 RepID=A0ABU5QEF1_9BACT|nr:L-rhamnose mutarotase [Arcicella rigui]MEA5141098.1 L-rhamnose mutarotase [Arcicella rigui]
MKRYCLTLNLKDDEDLIAQYQQLYEKMRIEIEAAIIDSGILNMEIYRIDTRLFMVIDTVDDFSFEAKNNLDIKYPKKQEWESLICKYQKILPIEKNYKKWVLMNTIYELNSW